MRINFISRFIKHRRNQTAGLVFFLAFIVVATATAESLVSPTWGFSINLPEAYDLSGGDGKTRFSFVHETGAAVDMIVYPSGRYKNPVEAANDITKRLMAKTDISSFNYRGRAAVIISLAFSAPSGPAEGWALCVELDSSSAGSATSTGSSAAKPLLLVLAYGPSGGELEDLQLSVLDSVAPSPAERLTPGPISDFAYPKQANRTVELTIGDSIVSARIDSEAAAAAKAVVDREFTVLSRYLESPLWQEAWQRFYSIVYRDAYDRLADVAFAVERSFAIDYSEADAGRRLAQAVLAWTQSFSYERDPEGSDFVDLVTAAIENRGDCDSRALLMALILRRSNIGASIMVSKDYSHAMALCDLSGSGARFTHSGIDWLVAETTARVDLGLIAQDVADPTKWLGIPLP